MSLINQMLRDLEERRETPSVASVATLQTPVVMAPLRHSDRRKLIYALSAIAVVSIALLAWQWLVPASGSPANTAQPPASPASGSGIMLPLPAPLAKAEQVTPVEQPAGQTMPAHVAAADPVASAIPAAQASPEMQAKPLPIMPAPRVTTKAAVAPKPAPGAAPDIAGAIAANAKPAKQTPAVEPTPAKAASRPSGPRHIEITEHQLTTAQKAQRHYTEAVKALRAGDIGTSLQQLGQALVIDHGHHQARMLLAGLYINQQRKQQAESLLVEGLALHPLHAPFAKLHAQLLVEQAREQEAIQSLQSALPGAGQDAEYHALLAGLYQRNGEPGTAADHYRTALQYAPDRGEWWLGLGLSQEQAGNRAEARAAYGQALKLPLNAALQNYAGMRLKQLSREPQPGT